MSARTLLVGAATALLLAAPAAPAAAGEGEDGFRYWNYSLEQGGALVPAQVGAGDNVPADGSFEGWRFGTSTVANPILPRADGEQVSFDAVCGDAEAADGEKRVAVLLDYGVEADAADGEVPQPRAACAVVPEDASGLDALQSVADVRDDSGLICGVDGYPADGCGEPVADAQVPTTEEPVDFALPGEDPGGTDEGAGDTAAEDGDTAGDETADDGGFGWPVVVGVLVVLILLAGLVLTLRRRTT